MKVIPLTERRTLAGRVVPGAYYTDGRALFEVDAIGATGCVTLRSCWNGGTRCFGIEDFRAKFWLVKVPSMAASVAA